MVHGHIPEVTLLNPDQQKGARNPPRFDVIVMDPPWPNRSALRKDAYITAEGGMGIEGLLRG